MSEIMNKENSKEELIIPTDLKTFLSDIADSRLGFELGAPWKYSEEALVVVVPILRKAEIEREYVTMYEVLKELGMKDTGNISQVELQNKTGKAVFVRAGTIFTGATQNRAAQHSGVYTGEKEKINVRCVHAVHPISSGQKMEFGDIAPASVTMNLMAGDQSDVWNSIRDYTGGSKRVRRFSTIRHSSEGIGGAFDGNLLGRRDERVGYSGDSTHYAFSPSGSRTKSGSSHFRSSGLYSMDRSAGSPVPTGSPDLLGHLEKMKSGKAVLDDMMQRAPLFDNQVGAIIIDPVGVVAFETFDSKKSWESVKKEVIEKYGDKTKEQPAEHLFEMKPEMIPVLLKKFISQLDNMKESTIRKDGFSETREVLGKDVVGEYTLVKGQPIHVLLLKEDNT